MEYIYAAMLLHSAGKEINEAAIENIIGAAGIKPDNIRIKALVAALAEVNIDEALKMPVLTAATVAPIATPAEEEEEAKEKPKEEKKEEEDLQGLGALFG